MYLVREQNNDLLLFLGDEKPFKHNGSWKTKHNCQSVMLDSKQHPDVQWIDVEPTECEIVPVGRQKQEPPKFEQFVVRANTRVECPRLSDDELGDMNRPLIGGYYCRNCEYNMQTNTDEETGNLLVKCGKEAE